MNTPGCIAGKVLHGEWAVKGRLNAVAFVTSLLAALTTTWAQTPQQCYRDGRATVERAKRLAPITSRAKNVILFIGDGMSVTTVTAARIFAGQQRGESGEENFLSFERFPYSAFVKTYNVDAQTPDSAGTATAMMTGVKSNAGMLCVNQHVTRGDHESIKGNRLTTLIEIAEKAGLSTGVVTTTRVTDATPAACYAHSPDRDWEASSDLPPAASQADFPDIARQLIEFSFGDGPEVVLGGGRRGFLPNTLRDPEYPAKAGTRDDGRDLTAEWLRKPQSVYVWNVDQFAAVDPQTTRHLLGLFEPSHMQYEHDRPNDKAKEPSLAEMTSKAIELLSKSDKGFVLMVESGRIDHAHHANNPYRALTETIQLDNAVQAALKRTKRLETLIIVTADHGHMLTMGGYAKRGNPILGKAAVQGERGTAADVLARDAVGLPYTPLLYAMGPGFTGPSDEQVEGIKTFPHRGRGYKYSTKGRPDLTNVDTTSPDYLSEAVVPADSAPHSGADVPLYADGPQAHLFHGVLEQNVIFHVMVEALGLTNVAEEP